MTRAPAVAGKPAIVPRRIDWDFSEVPRHWFGGNVVLTHMSNGLHLLFPAGERFFVRSVRHFLPQIEDGVLRARAKAFFGQEVLHGQAHDSASGLLAAHGIDTGRFLRFYHRFAFGVLEPIGTPALRLSVTAALEHLTAALAEAAFVDGHLEPAHPQMKRLLLWHAAEEIEHKSVAFDVLAEVDGRYWMRVLGMIVAVVGLVFFWSIAHAMLMRSERIPRRRRRAEIRAITETGQGRQALWAPVREYLRRGFHPDQNDNYHLAERWLESQGLAA